MYKSPQQNNLKPTTGENICRELSAPALALWEKMLDFPKCGLSHSLGEKTDHIMLGGWK